MKKKPGIIVILIMLCLIPALTAIVVNGITSFGYMKSTVEDEIEETLRSTGCTLLEAFNVSDDGKYWLSGKLLYKGGSNLTVNCEIVDAIQEETGIECTVFYGDTRYVTTVRDSEGGRQLLTQCNDDVKEMVLNQGNTYFTQSTAVNGQDYYDYYIPLMQDNRVIGMVQTSKLSTELTTATGEYLLYILIVSIVLIVFIIIITILVGKLITKRIQTLRDDAVKLSEGNLDFQIVNKNNIRELYEVTDAVNKLRARLIDVVQMILSCSGKVDDSVTSVDDSLGSCSTAVKDLSTAMEELSLAAQSMAESVEKEAFDMNEISNNITEISEGSLATKEVTENVARVSSDAKENLNGLLEANSYTTVSADDVITSISSVNNAVKQITAATQMIMDISAQTNLLSLNASIEAARAGEAGRGFAVVAGEIQKLAEQSNTSAKQIQSIIEEITAKTEECTKIAAQIHEAVGKESDALKTVSRSFENVESHIAEAAGAAYKITEVVALVEKNKISILDSVTDLSGISEENAASAEEASASSEELKANVEKVSRQAAELKSVIEQLNSSVAFFCLPADKRHEKNK